MAPANEKNALLARWGGTLARKGGAPAVLDPAGRTTRTFREIEEEARNLIPRLGDLPARSVVAVQIGNSAIWPAVLLALFRQKLIPLPLGRHMGTAERDSALSTCGAVALIESGEDGIRISRIGREPAAIETDFLKLTSGTTAAPRAIRFWTAQLVADGDHICETMGLREEDVNYGVIPFSHSYGFSNLLTPLLCRGIALVASEDRMPRAILDGLARSGATVFPGMPVFYEKLGELENAPALPRLRLCISAGAPLSQRVAERFSSRFGRKIHTFYGSSECGGIGYDASEALDYADGFAGQPMRGVSVTPLDPGEVTRIEVRSPAVGDGYFPIEDPEVLGEGRFIPGDLVRVSAGGMEIVGRSSDLINVAGRKLNPAEVEAQLCQLAGVKQVVVFGVPSALRHEEAIACVAGGLSAAEVLRFARAALSPWQVPKDVWIVEEIPVNERGKIARREIAAHYLKNRSS